MSESLRKNHHEIDFQLMTTKHFHIHYERHQFIRTTLRICFELFL